MSSFLPFDIIELIIDIIGELKDIDLLKGLALVSHFVLHICRKYLFAAIDLYDPVPFCIVKYIRKLTYNISRHHPQDNLPILPNFLRTISHLDSLTITDPHRRCLNWNTLDPALKSALLFLMHLPTINHISLAWTCNFPLSALTPCLNLNWLDMFAVELTTKGDSLTESTHLEVPRIHRYSTAIPIQATIKLLDAKWRDGRPAFDFRHLKQLSMPCGIVKNVQILLQYAKQLEELRIEAVGMSYERLHEMIYPSAHTLRFFSLSVPFHDPYFPLAELCKGLEAMAGHYKLEALEFRVDVGDSESKDVVGSRIRGLEKVLVKPGWSTLKHVSFEMLIPSSWRAPRQTRAQSDALQSVPEKYLSRILKPESITFKYSVNIEILKKWEHEDLGFRYYTSQIFGFWKFCQFAGSVIWWMIRRVIVIVKR